MQRISPAPKIHPEAECILTRAISKLYWLVLSSKQNNISAASPFHFPFFQSPSHLTVWELPVKCRSALTRHGMEEDNLLVFSPPCFSQPWPLTWATSGSSLPPDCKTAKVFSADRVCGNITSILMASYWQCLGPSLLACKHLLRSVKPLWHLCVVCKRKGVAKDLHWRLSLYFIRSCLKNAIWRFKLDLVWQFRRDQWSFISYRPNLRARIPLPEIAIKLFLSRKVGFMLLATIFSP